MNEDSFDRLNRAIDKYEQGSYDESDFHLTLDSIGRSITESHLYDLRVFLENMEADLERIDFTVNDAEKRNEYLKIIKQIKDRVLLKRE